MKRVEAIKMLQHCEAENYCQHYTRTKNCYGCNRREALDMSIEALQDRPKGEWKTTVTGQPYCFNCEYVFGEDEEFSPFWDYCPMCGARMENKE